MLAKTKKRKNSRGRFFVSTCEWLWGLSAKRWADQRHWLVAEDLPNGGCMAAQLAGQIFTVAKRKGVCRALAFCKKAKRKETDLWSDNNRLGRQGDLGSVHYSRTSSRSSWLLLKILSYMGSVCRRSQRCYTRRWCRKKDKHGDWGKKRKHLKQDASLRLLLVYNLGRSLKRIKYND